LYIIVLNEFLILGAFGSLWSGGGGQVEAKPPPTDPQSILSIAHSLKVIFSGVNDLILKKFILAK
jgi:hypothetical protein